jgi:hypothetical protein
MSDWFTNTWTASNGFTQPKLLLENFNCETINMKDVMGIVRSALSFPSELLDQFEDPLVRVYIDGGLRLDVVSNIRHKLPDKAESFETWSRRVFSSDRFALAINHCEILDTRLARDLATAYYPIIKGHLPLCAVDTVLLTGNYGYTYDGIHKDGPNQPIIHLHLGPNRKPFYCWDPIAFEKLTGSSESCFEPERLCHAADAYAFEPGSTFVMPGGHYHIANNPELSATLSLGFDCLSQEEVIAKAITMATTRLIAERRPEKATCTNCVVWNPRSSDSWVEYAIMDYKLSLESNCRYPYPALRVAQGLPCDDDTFVVNRPYALHLWHIAEDGILLVYVRGHRIAVPGSSELISLIERLNSGASIHVSPIDNGAGAAKISDESRHLLNHLFEFGGIVSASDRQKEPAR